MKKITQTMYYDRENLASHGFTSEQQKMAVCCIGELLEEIKKCDAAPFGMMLFFITEADMLGDKPVTIWSGFDTSTMRRLFEDYVIRRLEIKEGAV